MAEKETTKKELITHIGLVLGISLAIILLFFYLYLPWTTNHGESITVPDIVGKTTTELEDFLDEKDLRYEINDSTYDPNVKPLTVMSQYPKPNSKVKEGRKIYVTIRAIKPPQVKMPQLVDASLLNAQMVLQSYGLVLGGLQYEPHYAENAVLKQLVNGRPIAAGTSIAKGTKVVLVVGSGTGEAIPFELPNFVNQPYDEASLTISGQGLSLGSVVYVENAKEAPGTVIRQKPEAGPGKQIKQGEIIDLWVAGPNPKQTAEDGQ